MALENDRPDPFEVDPAELQLFEKVGTGCTAEVFRANWGRRVVAVKQIDWDKSSMGQKEQMAFDREVAIMPRLEHPNLVQFLGVCSLMRPFKILTEFCAGGCCFELLHNCDQIDLMWWQQFKMCEDVAKGMNHLHTNDPQIVHRDLKSLNLLLAEMVSGPRDIPLVKVSDFGLSRMKEAGAEYDWGKMTIAAGTCHWMAPEVFQGSTYNEKVDIYSYAMILFEVICREIPYEEEDPAQVGQLTVEGMRPDLEAVPPDCPKLLKELMMRCWHADPDERPPFRDIVVFLKQIEPQIPGAFQIKR